MKGPPGTELATRLIDATMWSEDSRGLLPLGAVSFELPVLVLDPSCMGVWPVWVLGCAPLAAILTQIESAEKAKAWSSLALGASFLEVKSIDVKLIEQAQKDGSGKRFPGMLMGVHMGFMSLCRNNANFMQAACGESVELDRMRGGNAMLCARLKSKELRVQDVNAMLEHLFKTVKATWGPTSFALSGSRHMGDKKVEHPEFLRPWPCLRGLAFEDKNGGFGSP